MQNYYVSEDMNGRFANEEELQKAFHKANLKAKNTKYCGIPLVSDGTNVLVPHQDEHAMVIGGSGSKKTRLLVLPAVMSIACAGNSLIVNDPKGEIHAHTRKLLEKKNYVVKVLNFRDPSRCDSYNPLYVYAKLYRSGQKAKAIEGLKDFAENIYEPQRSEKDPFWTETAKDYFVALAIAAIELLPPEYVTLEVIFEMHIRGQGKSIGSCVMKDFFQMVVKDRRAHQFAEATIGAPNDTRTSVNSVFMSGLSKLLIDDSIIDMISGTGFDIRELGTKKMAVFLISRDESSIHNALITSLIQQFYTELVDVAEEHDGVLPIPVEFVLDEFGNLPKIADINAKITAARSRSIRFLLVVQSLEQLSYVYGRDLAQIIMGNATHWVYLNSSDPDLNELLVKRCGTYVTEHTNERKQLMPMERIQNLSKEEGEVLLLLARQRPFVTYLPDVSEYCLFAGKEKIELPLRKPSEKRYIDIPSAIQKVKEETMARFMKENEKKKPERFFDLD